MFNVTQDTVCTLNVRKRYTNRSAWYDTAYHNLTLCDKSYPNRVVNLAIFSRYATLRYGIFV